MVLLNRRKSIPTGTVPGAVIDAVTDRLAGNKVGSESDRYNNKKIKNPVSRLYAAYRILLSLMTTEFYRKIYLRINRTARTYITGLISFAFLHARLIST